MILNTVTIEASSYNFEYVLIVHFYLKRKRIKKFVNINSKFHNFSRYFLIVIFNSCF